MTVPPASRRPGCLLGLAGCAGLIFAAGLALVSFVILFYVEENWRGHRAWTEAKAEFRGHGENPDPQAYIPAPVPDAENFAALPWFRTVTVNGPRDGTGSERFALTQTLKPVIDHLPLSANSEQKGLPFLGIWLKGETIDAASAQAQLRAFLHDQMPGAVIPHDATPTELFASICPVLAELRAANATHTQCRFDLDYGKPHPWNMDFGPITGPIKISQVLAYDARLALLSGDPAQALEDFRVAFKIASGVRQEPTLVAGLVSDGVVAIELAAINQGLAEHAWNDQQLDQLDHDLGSIDLLSATQFTLRGELFRFGLPMIDYYAANRSKWLKGTQLMQTLTGGTKDEWSDLGFNLTYWLLPTGWFEISKARSARARLATIYLIDPAAHRVHPEWEQTSFPGENDIANRWLNFISPYESPVKNAVMKAAYFQAQIDEARIACQLERYRLAKGSYPAALAELGADIPRDIMSGDPYHYRLNPNHTYLLYSVGWNQVDDHGDAGPHRTSDSPDWIWTSYPSMK